MTVFQEELALGSICQLLAEELKQRGLVRLGEVRHVDDVCRAHITAGSPVLLTKATCSLTGE